HLNLGWNGVYLWDGKVEGTLEDVMLFEVKDFFQTDLSQLNSHATYPQLFKNAFNVDEITYKEAAYALAQYQRTMISGNSKWDKYLLGEATLTQAEAQGYEIFFTEKGDCFHCHGTILFTDNLFHNNGLDSLPEQGRAKVTGDIVDVGKYKSPTLRNIMLTAPYMHNAKYATIEEVIDYYSEGIVWSETVDPLMKKVSQGGVHLTPQEKQNLIAFLHTLTDTTYLTNPDFSNPFQNK
ncbi:MAG: cytochrome c peroxidase, partial [Bacteroidota bacterium]